MSHLRKAQIAWGLLAAACFVGAGLLQDARRTRSDLWDILPGRAFVVSYLWIRADALKEQGRYYDAMQQAELICRLQRDFPGVWSFLSWNMAWNISVATRTPEERWRWVHNGIRLLRDRGIPLNPTSIILYKDLGWIYLFKIGGYLDDMHWVYKRQVATRMQDLLGAPPQGTTREVLDAFRPIADETLLDKDPQRQGRDAVQGDRLRRVLAEPGIGAYAVVLAAAGLKIDQEFLGAYNRYSLDEAVAAVRIRPPQTDTPAARAASRAVNDPAHAAARLRVLAFLRAQILWNVYRLDPAWMLAGMERFGPLDWRLPQAHGLYWLTLGLHRCKDTSLEDVDALNTQRNALNCLKELSWRGRLTMLDARPRSSDEDVLALEPVRGESVMDLPRVRLFQLPDLRFAEVTHREYLRAARELSGPSKRRFEKNNLRTGHINYLVGAIQMLYAGYRRAEAQKYLDWIHENYAPKGPNWLLRNVEDFVLYELRTETDPTRDFAESQIGVSMWVGLAALARGQTDVFNGSLRYAKRVHALYQKGRGERMRLPAFRGYVLSAALRLLTNPRAVGCNLSLADRSQLYRGLDADTQAGLYDRAASRLKRECENEGLDFDRAFPAPPGRAKKQQPHDASSPAPSVRIVP